MIRMHLNFHLSILSKIRYQIIMVPVENQRMVITKLPALLIIRVVKVTFLGNRQQSSIDTSPYHHDDKQGRQRKIHLHQCDLRTIRFDFRETPN